ncbi:MAG: hypothetical protein HY764_01775 [Candidatus Portnoybacteria bacterium]|nr:hypothetical protein [Candidatus Portnoybacteria bacterium]
MKKIFSYLFKNARKILIIFFIIAGALEILLAVPLVVKASNPTLSISVINSDTIQLTGYGDPSTSVILYYQNYQNALQSQYISSTNSSGYFSVNLNRYAYNINPGSYVYVIVNNQHSPSVAWPYSFNSTDISLSQTNLTLYPGQYQTVTISGNGGYYISNNSNSNAASASIINSNALDITGNAAGNTNITVCQSYGQCAVLYVSVSASQYNNYQNNDYYIGYNNQALTPITFSQSSLNLGTNQNANVTISGGVGNYYIDYISDEDSLRGRINNNILSLTSRSKTSRNVVIVCSSSYNNCAALSVIVGGSAYTPSGQNWSYCANENGHCSFSGTRSVRYGANGSYYYKTFTNGISCSNYIFGDPIFGVVKQCSISNY